jgi:hypothetical protein
VIVSRAKDWWNFRQAVLGAHRVQTADCARPRDVVLIPCWRRAEFLWHCLRNISEAEGASELLVLVRPDTGYSAENLEVVRAFSDQLPHLRIEYPVPCPYRRTKQSANVLLGYLQAAAIAHRFVFLIEEDVMVARDFFLWHRAVHAAAGKLFCSIAVKNPNRLHQLSGIPDAYYLNRGDYCSYGVCFDRRVVEQLIAPHVNLQYLRSPKRYLRQHFPASRISLGFVEQDGLLRRIQERSELPIAYPCLPRAYDAGFYGYNRPGGIEGSLRERVQALDAIIYDQERMRGVTSPEFADRCVSVGLQPPAWETLRLTELAG